MAQKTAIEAEGLNKWFGEGDAKTHAVKNVSFQAYFGEMLYVVGPSGSGKTTMLSMISGILRPNSGTVKIEDTAIWTLGDDALAEFRLHKIGFVFQDYHLFPRLTAAENARAIVSRPDILIFDEPTASLDGDTGRNIVKFVREHILSDQRCILIVTHDSRIYEYADRIVKMEDGKMMGIEREKLDAQ